MAKAKGKRVTKDEKPVVSDDAIEKMHNLLAEQLRDLLDCKPRIAGSPADWRKRHIGQAEFFLEYENDWLVAGDTSSLGRTTPVVVIPLPSSNRRKRETLVWAAGWYEKWIVADLGELCFNQAGWSIYCGFTRRDLALVLRADWQQPASPENAGQPHWHIYKAIDLMDSAQAYAQAGCDQLEELSPHVEEGDLSTPTELRSTQDVSSRSSVGIERLHLAMAGWSNSEKSPGCWQYCPKGDMSKMLSQWCVRSLMYIRGQLGEYST